MERKMKRIEELDRKEKEEAALEHARQAMLIEKAEEAAKKKEEAEFKKRVLAEAEREKFEEELRKKKKKEEEDKFFHARLKEMYLAQGYSEESIEIMIKDAEEKKKKGHGNEIVKITEQTKVVDLSKSTWIKVNRKYMSPETLDAHGLPWEWDDRDNTYIIIKRWINENDLDKLFEHTRKLRERRLAIPNEANMVGLIKENGKLKLVREKSPNRRRRSFVLS
ncbi:MAG: hypothetical protein LQ338_003024 [Usnochroma carphineum]|nr:MAG: hypothetical protein LQ338_003024 [Usnochroma carphineum]